MQISECRTMTTLRSVKKNPCMIFGWISLKILKEFDQLLTIKNKLCAGSYKTEDLFRNLC